LNSRQLLSQYRDSLRLDVEKKWINTDRQIAGETNTMKENTELDTLKKDKKLNRVKAENQSRVQETSLTEKYKITVKQREFDEQTFREVMRFKSEKEQSQHEMALLKKALEIKRLETEKELVKGQQELELMHMELAIKHLELDRMRQDLEQSHSPAALTETLLRQLPEIFAQIKIGNYSVLSGGAGNISPVTRILSEVLTLLNGTDLNQLFGTTPGVK